MSKHDGSVATGRHGRLDLAFEECGGKTAVRESYAAMPMHFLPPFHPDGTGWAYAYLVNPTGGFVGGDRIEIDIALGERSHLFLASQSAAKIYRSTGSFSSQSVNVALREGAALEYLSGLVIPFAGSFHRQATRIRMEKKSRAFVTGSLAAGRVARGEHLAFEHYESATEIEYDGRLLVLDNILLRPKTMDYSALGLMESASVSAAVYLISDDLGDVHVLAETVHDLLQGCDGVLGGVSPLRAHGLVVRLLGQSASCIERAVRRIWCKTRSSLFPGARGMTDADALYRRLVSC